MTRNEQHQDEPPARGPFTAPFPWFGGKTKVATEVWARFGNVENYVEPFGGSLAVLLARPDDHQWWLKRESAGDFAGHVVNFFRAVAADPDAVAEAANWPITEADLTARHLYLVRYQNTLAEKLAADPVYFDAQAAGWWVWGISSWVGGDWMTGMGPWKPGDPSGPGVYRKLPMMSGSHGGKGIHKPLKDVPFEFGEDAPNIDAHYLANLKKQFTDLSNRLRRVRLACGDWSRLTKSVVDAGGTKITGVFLDPPYDLSLRRGDLYGSTDRTETSEMEQVHEKARAWAIANGNDPLRRIAYCSYSTPEEDQMFHEAGWFPYRWSASGGYGLQSNNEARDNKDKEIIWFSPHCLNDPPLF